ncbi:MAG: hypothetical protein WCB15_02120, partial [Desulfobacterales bacterium]
LRAQGMDSERINFINNPNEIKMSAVILKMAESYIPYSGTFFKKPLNYRGSHDLAKICSRRIKWC